jgi:hypothetical protein
MPGLPLARDVEDYCWLAARILVAPAALRIFLKRVLIL